MTYTVSSSDGYSLYLNQNDAVRSILQNIAVLLCTKKGTVPMYREFGLSMEFVDKPPEVAETLAFSEISEALEMFEPRAALDDLYFEKTKDGNIGITVRVKVNEGNGI